jgi:hypothetical protein
VSPPPPFNPHTGGFLVLGGGGGGYTWRQVGLKRGESHREVNSIEERPIRDVEKRVKTKE